jgi:PAS domain S-box-containing protein
VLAAASAVRGFPVYVISGSTERAVLAPWRAEAKRITRRTFLTSAAMVALIALAAWGLARREQELKRNEQRFRAMIERSTDAVVLFDPQRDAMVYASPAFERITGWSAEDLRGRPVDELVHPEQREVVLRARAELLRTPGLVTTDEMQVRRKDGGWVWIELISSNLTHEPGVAAIVNNFRDISERKGAEEERARLEQRLRQAEKMEAVGRLAGGIAHDFNNILGGILGYSEMLAEQTPEGSSLRRYANNVLTAANRARELVDQILAYSRSHRSQRVPIDLGRAVAETLDLLRGSLPPGIALESDLPAAPVHVVGDATQLHQVLMNLCTNAIQASGEAGRLRVSLRSVEVAERRALRHGTLLAGSYAALTVADHGAGMDEVTLGRIFEPFFTTKEVGKGTGLGLSLVYGIVTDSGGAIEVASRPGDGSSFTIYLPRVEGPAIAAEEQQGQVKRGNGQRILVIDDEAPIVAVTTEVLLRLGYKPVGFSDSRHALAELESAPASFDAVITDEVMPGLSGTELAARVHRLRPDLPIVLVSGYIGPMMSERAHAAGVSRILKKPVQSRETASSLAELFHL